MERRDAHWQLDTVRTTWVLTDRQGTVRDLLGKDVVNGTAYTQHIDYDAFGIPSDISGLASEVTTYYAGREYDSYTDLYYNRARWYDAAMQRFISEDPMGFAGGDPNLYRYCGNSPINATDPSGMIWSWATAGAGAAIGSGIYLVSSAFTGEFSWSGLGAAAGAGFVAGAVVGAFAGDPTALGVSAVVMGVGAGIGAVHGGLETYAANHDAGPLEYTAGIGLGGVFGALNPYGEFASAGGAIVGGSIEYANGGEFLGLGFEAGGLVGAMAGGFGTAARQGFRRAGGMAARRVATRAALRQGAYAVAPELGGATIGGVYGFFETGTLAGTTHCDGPGLADSEGGRDNAPERSP